MAKKQPVSKSDPAVAAPKKTPARKPPASPALGLSSDMIGDTAGKIWHTLSVGPQTVANLKKSIDAPGDLVLVALGWLAREGKLAFDASGRSVTVSLR